MYYYYYFICFGSCSWVYCEAKRRYGFTERDSGVWLCSQREPTPIRVLDKRRLPAANVPWQFLRQDGSLRRGSLEHHWSPVSGHWIHRVLCSVRCRVCDCQSLSTGEPLAGVDIYHIMKIINNSGLYLCFKNGRRLKVEKHLSSWKCQNWCRHQ